ncbi:hypothetical protein ABY45_16355 [Microbacterium maritypicum]|uniref:hypothetical protein n=1 Tax=Microbacterium maritypicum TaxID=33918 RepID=UPI003D6E4684
MTFGRDLDLEGFTRAFADHDIRALLGLDVPDAAAEKIAGDSGLIRNVYDKWQRAQQSSTAPAPRAAAPAKAAAPIPPRTSTAKRAPHPLTSGPAGTMSEAEMRGPFPGATPTTDAATGFWAVISAVAAVAVAWVAMGIGFALADARRIPRGEFRLLGYGKESFLVAGDSLVWASVFTAIALILFIVGIVRGGRAGKRSSFVGGIVVAFVTIVIIFNAVDISTW